MAELLAADDTVSMVVVSGPWNSGDLKLTDDGRVGIVVGCKPAATGDVVSLRTKGRIRILAGANLTKGDVGGVHVANQTLLASGASGATDGGTVLHTVASGSYAELDLNEFPYTASA